MPKIYIKYYILSLMLFLINCSEKYNKQSGNIHEKYEFNLLVERWGNEEKFDHNVNFREFFYYNEKGALVKNIYYSLADENKDCIIKDSLRFIETRYKYKDGKLHLEEKYHPLIDNQGNVLKHELIFVFDHIQKRKTYNQ